MMDFVTEPPDPPRLLVNGRPVHDWFPDGQPIRLRLAPDFTPAEWVPLWPSSDETDALVPSPLLERLVAWQEEFWITTTLTWVGVPNECVITGRAWPTSLLWTSGLPWKEKLNLKLIYSPGRDSVR